MSEFLFLHLSTHTYTLNNIMVDNFAVNSIVIFVMLIKWHTKGKNAHKKMFEIARFGKKYKKRDAS